MTSKGAPCMKKSSIKIMLLGIMLILFGIYLRTVFIGYEASAIFETLWTATPIAGVMVFLYGFFRKENKDR